MTIGIVDTTVIIHLLREYPPAEAWFAAQKHTFSITSVTWIEVVRGSANKHGLVAAKELMSDFEMLYLTQSDQDWAMDKMFKHRLSHGIQTNDCLIASVVHRLKVPIYTHNVKDMVKILPASLIIKPY